jgi:hypothetical protein
MRDEGARAVQTLAMDFWPLILLFAISITGLALTVSQEWLGGSFYDFIAILHAITMIATLLYLPFGKFFHIFQRPAQLGVAFYRKAGAQGEPARCARCGDAFASRMHVDDLKQVEQELGIRYEAVPTHEEATRVHYQDVCPACRRKTLALTQDALWRRGV